MTKAFLAVAVAALTAMLVPGNFAAEKHYIITNDDNSTPGANTATIFEVNTETAALKQVRVLQTGGTGGGGGYFAAPRNAIDSSGKCLFVSDAGTSDIASFATPDFTKVGNYSDSQLNGALPGMGVTASPNGRYLFAAYSNSDNIAVWNIGSDCSLTLNGSPYSPGGAPDSIAVTPDGNELVVSMPDSGEITSFSVSPAGALTAQPALQFARVGDCRMCLHEPAGLDITNDGKTVVAANASPYAPYYILTATLSSAGLSSPGYHTHSTATANPQTVWFSPGAADGHGILYVGMTGFDAPKHAGIVSVEFNETPLRMSYVTEVRDSGPINYGSIQTIGTSGTGGLLAVAEQQQSGSAIDVYKVNGNTGALTQNSTTNDPQSGNLQSITAFPKRPTH